MKAIKTEPVLYKHDGAECEGYFAYDGSTHGKRPGVLLAHTWVGQDPLIRRRAVQLAQLGYAAFAVDMYGGGKLAADAKEAEALHLPFKKDRALMRGRINAGLDAFRQCRIVDSRSIAAVGYCFGGCVVLELARSGADIRGAVGFHALLDTPKPEETKGVRAKILLFHGAEDPLAPPEQVRAFQDEMTKAGVDWQIVIYGGAVHAFTNPDAGTDKSTGKAYNEQADKRSWQAMRNFFDEIF